MCIKCLKQLAICVEISYFCCHGVKSHHTRGHAQYVFNLWWVASEQAYTSEKNH